MQENNNNRTKSNIMRIILIGVTICFVFGVIGGSFGSKPASAQIVGPPTPVIVTANPWQAILDAIKKAIKITGDIAFKNTVRAFLNKVAYDSAVYIASGGVGQKPLFITKPGEFITGIGDAAVGDYLDRLSVHVFGKSLCEPIDLQTKVKLDIFARKALEPPSLSGRCTITKIGENFDKSWDKNTSQQLIDFSYTFNPEQNEFGAFLKIQGDIAEAKAGAEQSERDKSLLSGFQAVVSPITGAIKTPSTLVEKGATIPIEQAFAGYTTQTGSPIADAVGTFTNTLVSKLLERIFKQGYNPETESSFFSSSLTSRGGGIAAARSIFSRLGQPDFVSGGSIDIVTELASCPSNPTFNNCIIDSRFSQAIKDKLTVREAIEQGLLDTNKTFGFNLDGTEPEYLNGYPYRSLVILRKYRIVPVGWELAALFIRDFSESSFSLQEVMDKFNLCGQRACSNDTMFECTNDQQCPDDDGDGVSDGTCTADMPYSTFCGLVDPDWVLKAPEVFCKREGAGESLASTDWSDQDGDTGLFRQGIIGEDEVTPNERQVIRRERCTDDQSCIQEGPDGTCQRFGYCTEERDVWRFQGEACNENFASCQTFVDPNGKNVSYLEDTIERNNCNAANAGCTWYCQEENVSTGEWKCDYGLDVNGEHNRLGLDRDTTVCEASAAGCDEFIRTKSGLGTNLLRNGSFEIFDTDIITDAEIDDGIDDSGPALFDYGIGNTAEPLDVSKDAFSGQYAMKVTGDGVGENWYAPASYYTFRPTGGRTFTASFYAKLDNCADGSETVNSEIQLNSFPAGMWGVDKDGNNTQGVTYDLDTWQRYVRTVTFPRGHTPEGVELILRGVTNCTVVYDAIQLEEGGVATQYKEYGAVNRAYLTGLRESCDAKDVGCDLYSPLSGGIPVTGQITDPSTCNPNDPLSCDQCPAAFVGCKAFREMPVEHTPRRPAREPVSFVPSTGKICPATQVGCEEYTNLDEVARGGEGLEYYSFIRMCVKPANAGAEAQNYYTWIGSEEAGFQLKAFNLLRSIQGGAIRPPCTNVGLDDPALPIGQRYPACVDSVPFDEDGDGTIEPHTPAVCTVDDLYINPDCAEFFDQNGNTSYRLRSRIIFVTEECHPYKNTIDTVDGRDTTYHMVPGEGVQCSSVYAGCREYQGSAGSNVRTLISSTFENGTILPWLSNADPALNPSNNSTQAGGHSMVVFDLGFGAPPGAWTPVDTLIQRDQSYILKFWAAGGNNEVSIEAGFYDAAGNIITLADGSSAQLRGTAIARAGDWNQYTLGPLYFDATVPPGAFLFIGGSRPFYLDNIELLEVTDDIFMVRDSYTECSGYENCAAYKDRDGLTHYLKSFSKICEADALGCEALIETQNNEYPFTQDIQITRRPRGDFDNNLVVDSEDRSLFQSYFNGRCITGSQAGTSTPCDPEAVVSVCGVGETCKPGINRPDPWAIMDVNGDGVVNIADNVSFQNAAFVPVPYPQDITIPEDQTVFVINDPQVACQSNQAGCTKMGKPVINSENQVSGYELIYLVNDPDQYGDILCQQEEHMCQEYTSDDGFAYFKDPGSKTCEFNIPSGSTSSGWYRTGTSTGCGEQLTSSSIALGMVGQCPAAQSGCTEFLDPLDPEGCNVNVPANQDNVGRCDNNSPSPGAFCDTTAFCGAASPNAGLPCDILDPGADCGYAGPGVPHACLLALPAQCGAGLCVPQAACSAYYYIENTVDKTTCNNVVSDLEGCRLFFNTDTPPPIFYAKGTGEGSAPSGACDNNPLTPARLDCDSNEVIKVQRDRVCNKWLECASGTTVINARGDEEEVCFQRRPCNKLDPISGECIGFKECSDTHQSCSRDSECINGICTTLDPIEPDKVCTEDPSFRCTGDPECDVGAGGPGGTCDSLVGADLIYTSSDGWTNNMNLLENFSGLTRVGVNWGLANRCSNNPTIPCNGPGDCGGAACGVERLIEGNYPYSAMYEIGISGASSKDLVKSGDFWDSNFLDVNEIRPNSVLTTWRKGDTYAGWSSAPASGDDVIFQLTEMGDDGSIPGNVLLNENNILEVKPGGTVGAGVEYDLGLNMIPEGEYTLSFMAKYENANAQEGDIINISLNQGANVINTDILNNSLARTFSPDWEQYILGPIQSFNAINETTLRFAQGIGSGRTFYLDDVSLKPVLKVHTDSGSCSNDNTKTCTYNDNCDAPGICLGSGSNATPDKIVRTCRMYPRENSPLCEYVDFDGVQYKGWKGYCIETDPKNPSVCLNWWPVDIIAGETTLFGQEQSAGYSGRSPLYYCAETEDKEPTIEVPRYVCMSSFSRNSDGGGARCHTLAIVNKLRPAGFLLTPESGWVYGSSENPSNGANADSWCNITPDEDTANCCVLEKFGGSACTGKELVRFEENGTWGYDWKDQTKFNECLDELKQYYDDIVVRTFADDGGRDDEGCGADNWGDGNGDCSNSNSGGLDDDCEYGQLKFNREYTHCYEPDYNDPVLCPRYFDDGANWKDDENFPQVCNKVVQTVTNGNENLGWASRLNSGNYSVLSPVGYSLQQACNKGTGPYGALPTIQSVDDFVSCQQTVTSPNPGSVRHCVSVGETCNSDGTQGINCEFQPARVEQYHPYNPDNSSTDKVCSTTIAGQGFYACGGHCGVCVGGTNNGNLCYTDADCGGALGKCTGIISGETITNAIDRLKRLFADAYHAWDWDGAKYLQDDILINPLNVEFQDMNICVDGSGTRNIRPPYDGTNRDYCAVQPHVENFTIEILGQGFRNDIAPAGRWNLSYPMGTTIKLSFTAHVDEEQLPLSAILIDWDGLDGTKGDRQGSMTWGFAPRSDPKNPHEFFYVLDEAGKTYIPKIQLIDNWSTCSNVQYGTCDAASGELEGWLCPQETDCGTGSCNLQNFPVDKRSTSCNGRPDDKPGWYSFNGQITTTP